jgi:hypothetical protein
MRAPRNFRAGFGAGLLSTQTIDGRWTRFLGLPHARSTVQHYSRLQADRRAAQVSSCSREGQDSGRSARHARPRLS